MNIALVYHHHIGVVEVHSEDCKALTRKKRGSYWGPPEVRKGMTSDELMQMFNEYTDEPHLPVHACCRSAFSKNYLKGVRPA